MITERNPVTASYYPDPLTVDEFARALTTPDGLAAFAENMKHISLLPETWSLIQFVALSASPRRVLTPRKPTEPKGFSLYGDSLL